MAHVSKSKSLPGQKTAQPPPQSVLWTPSNCKSHAIVCNTRTWLEPPPETTQVVSMTHHMQVDCDRVPAEFETIVMRLLTHAMIWILGMLWHWPGARCGDVRVARSGYGPTWKGLLELSAHVAVPGVDRPVTLAERQREQAVVERMRYLAANARWFLWLTEDEEFNEFFNRISLAKLFNEQALDPLQWDRAGQVVLSDLTKTQYQLVMLEVPMGVDPADDIHQFLRTYYSERPQTDSVEFLALRVRADMERRVLTWFAVAK